jgi:(1->4)-alpha-D-glucan 1-alpha-D-glucosylmutase
MIFMGIPVPRAPQATYRLQLHAGFGFDDVAAVSDYLERLGVSHVYCSPYLQAAAGSTHGYDVVDPRRVNRELGAEPAHERMCAALGRHHLGQVLDIVPNHMSIADRDNLWWWDVLENGQSSRYAAYFDVEWHPPEFKLHNTVLLPILGDHYGRIIEAGEIRLERDGGSFLLRYHDRVAPVAPRSLDHLLASAAERCQSESLAFLADALGRLPLSTATDRTSIARRHRDKEVLRQQLARLCAEEPKTAAAVDQVVAETNVEPDALDALLERQNYRVAFWRTAGQELGYRRFFDINNLISLRMEDEQVFTDTHALVLDWLKRGVLDGVRIDHPDGLRDPEEYLKRLRAAAPEAWIVVEKILEPGENLPTIWPVAGTTGYDFIHRVNGLFVDPAGEQPLTSFYEEFTGETSDYAELVHGRKLMVLEQLFGSDVNRLTALFSAVCERHRRYRDYTRQELSAVLRELVACLPVYRTYVRPYIEEISETDASYTAQAVEAAKTYRPDLDVDLFHFLRDLLVLRIRGDVESELVSRFQQLTGAVMAKGVEDTTFYRFNRFVALNEVGDDPGRFGVSLGEFHQACVQTQADWPQTMLASSTHDTKRSEDVRARIALLAELPQEWRETVRRWSGQNDKHWAGSPPDRNAEYLYYQTLFGAWPLTPERASAYMEKACREAKQHTAWTNVNAEYEQTIRQFVTGTLGDADFVADLEAFVAPCLMPARITSLAQTLIKFTAPGVPDTYQGSELWDLSLVDPDNRRPVDFQLRRRLLAEAERASCAEAWARADEGLPKLWLIRRALELRQQRPYPFGAESSYAPLNAAGPKAEHVIAFVRGGEALTIVPRWPVRLGGDWAETSIALPEGDWRNLLDDSAYRGKVMLVDLLRKFPVALLVSSAV